MGEVDFFDKFIASDRITFDVGVALFSLKESNERKEEMIQSFEFGNTNFLSRHWGRIQRTMKSAATVRGPLDYIVGQ